MIELIKAVLLGHNIKFSVLVLVKCFTLSNGEGGNPAVVILSDQPPSIEAMKDIANIVELPVVTYVQEKDGKRIIRFFTAKAELPMCGHGSLAAANVLLGNTNMNAIEVVTQEGRKIILTRENEPDLFTVYLGKVTLSSITDKHTYGIKAVLTSPENQLAGEPHLGSVGSPKLLIPVASLDILDSLTPDLNALTKWSMETNVNGVYVYTTETKQAGSSFHARSFNPLSGNFEDAATGVAAAVLGSVGSNNSDSQVIIEQGYHMNHPSLFYVRTNAEGAHVGGSTKREGILFGEEKK